MLIGYAGVSTADQDLALQTVALTEAGYERLFTDKASGTKADRLGLAEALHFARAGDCIVVWKLDRLGRSHIPGSRSVGPEGGFPITGGWVRLVRPRAGPCSIFLPWWPR